MLVGSISWSLAQCLIDSNPGSARGKEPACNAGDIRDAGLIPGSGRSPGGGNGNPLQYSCPENPHGQGAGGLQSIGRRAGHD